MLIPTLMNDFHKESNELSAVITAENEMIQKKMLEIEKNFLATVGNKKEQSRQSRTVGKNYSSLDTRLRRMRSRSEEIST